MSGRIRDPARGEKILMAAADLFAVKGYRDVSMADIGRNAGIVGSGIYRHFDSKAAILVRLFDQVIDDLLEQGRASVEAAPDLDQALDALVNGQTEFVIYQRNLAQIYHREITNLPPSDQSRLRRKQRLYIEEWVHVLSELNDAPEAETRTRVHIAVGAIQSVLYHPEALGKEQTAQLLSAAAIGILRA